MDEQAKAKLLNEFTGVVRRAVDDYGMIEAGDRVAVGVSGGKDSMLLLAALNHLRSYYPKPFALEAVTIELGFPGMDFAPVAALCEQLGVPYARVKTDIKEVVFDVRQESNPCPQDKASKRYEIKKLLGAMSAEYPDMKSKIFGAMQRLPLDGWAPAETTRTGKEF